MNILYHHRTQAEDAQGIHIYEMVNAFKQLGHQVEIVSLVELNQERTEKTKGKRWEFIAKIVPDFVYELMEIAYNFLGFFLLIKGIKTQRPDFIYERYSLNTFCGIWTSKLFKIPLILEVNAPLYFEQKKYGKLVFEKFAKFSERWICSNSYRTIVVSSVMKGMLVDEGIPAEHMVVMHNGINPDEFNPEVDGSLVRDHYGIGRDKTVFGFVGWFRPWHGLDTILEVFKEDKLDQKGALLMLVGDGPAYDSLFSYAKEHDLLSTVTFTGPIGREKIPAHLAAFDVALQPSATKYASPMKIFECLAMGKPIIAPRQENICEILSDEFDSLMFDKVTKGSLRAVFNRILTEPNLQKNIGHNAYKTICTKGYRWRSNAQRSIDLLID